MRFSLSLFLLFVSFAAAYAQKERLYYNKKGIHTAKDSAASYVVFEHNSGGYDAQQSSMRDELLMHGNYTYPTPDLELGREGIFTYYHLNGKVSKEGAYKNNLRTGIWKSYSFSKGNLKNESHYDRDSLDGPSISYNVITGLKQNEGNYENGKKEGDWKYYGKGVLREVERYSRNRATQRDIYDSAGKVVRRLKYTDGKLVLGQAFDSTGREQLFIGTRNDSVAGIFNYVEQLPSPAFDLNKFLAENLHYPPVAEKKGIQGKVKVRFTVDELGRVGEVEVTEHVSPELDAEAIRVVLLMPDWRPGKQNGDPVKVIYTLPLSFKL